MKRINRAIATLLCLSVIVCSINSVAFAKNTSDTAKSTSINEYDYLTGLATKTDLELTAEGYSIEDISKIRNLDESYREHIKQLNYLSDYTLNKFGYSLEQISMIREFDGSKRQIRALSATVTLSLSIDYVLWSQSENRTNARLRYSFVWAGVPNIKTTDIVAVSWNNWTKYGSVSYVTYTNINGVGSDYYLAATYVPNSGPTSYGGGYRFTMTQDDNNYWARSGYGIFTLYHNYTRADLSAYAEYGHSTIVVTPSFTVPGYGSISFSFGTVEYDSKSADLECEN